MDKMDLTHIFDAMEDFRDARNKRIEETYDNIKQQAGEGDKDANTILNYGDERKIKNMINESFNRKA